jgi:hypothetical protein
VGSAVTHLWRLQFVIKVSARSFLHATCTCGTLLHPTYTCGTYNYSFVTLAIRHKNLYSVLSPSDVYLRDPLASDLGPDGLHVTCTWGPFSDPSASDLGPDGLRVTCTWGLSSVSIRLVGSDGLHVSVPVRSDGSRVTCTCGTFLHLHPTCGTRRLVYHVLPPRFNKFKLKKHETCGSNTGPRRRNRPYSPLH